MCMFVKLYLNIISQGAILQFSSQKELSRSTRLMFLVSTGWLTATMIDQCTNKMVVKTTSTTGNRSLLLNCPPIIYIFQFHKQHLVCWNCGWSSIWLAEKLLRECKYKKVCNNSSCVIVIQHLANRHFTRIFNFLDGYQILRLVGNTDLLFELLTTQTVILGIQMMAL